MTTTAKQHTRADRLREYSGLLEAARAPVAAMGVLVRAREARVWAADEPPEIVFARTEVDGRGLPAAVWVSLRRDDVDAAIEAMVGVSQTTFLIESREELGQGYRLQTIEETRPLPETDLLIAQLSAMLEIPSDVLAVLAEWGQDDPRTEQEIADLLDRRLGCGPAAPPRPAGPEHALTMSVADAVDVLRLSEEQARALATLVRRVSVTLTA